MVEKKAGLFLFTIFERFPEIVHGVTKKTFEKELSSKIYYMKQRHTNRVDMVDNNLDFEIDRDGMITNNSNMILGVKTADCVPFLLFDKKTKDVGVVHAGWRGILSGIVENAIFKMKKQGCDASDILVGIGPAIRGCCYDILEDRVSEFRNTFPRWENDILIKKNEKTYLNTPRLVVLQLLQQGVLRENIEDCEICTFESDYFYSYRRGDKDLRIISFIGKV